MLYEVITASRATDRQRRASVSSESEEEAGQTPAAPGGLIPRLTRNGLRRSRKS